MTPIEDPTAHPSTETARVGRPNDELENWLSDLRTEVAVDPPGWLDKEHIDPRPADPSLAPDPLPDEATPKPPVVTPKQRPVTPKPPAVAGLDDRPAPRSAEPTRGGRHRASD